MASTVGVIMGGDVSVSVGGDEGGGTVAAATAKQTISAATATWSTSMPNSEPDVMALPTAEMAAVVVEVKVPVTVGSSAVVAAATQ